MTMQETRPPAVIGRREWRETLFASAVQPRLRTRVALSSDKLVSSSFDYHQNGLRETSSITRRFPSRYHWATAASANNATA
jgi:hypothetical protein